MRKEGRTKMMMERKEKEKDMGKEMGGKIRGKAIEGRLLKEKSSLFLFLLNNNCITSTWLLWYLLACLVCLVSSPYTCLHLLSFPFPFFLFFLPHLLVYIFPNQLFMAFVRRIFNVIAEQQQIRCSFTNSSTVCWCL